jgi:hypothetical protein
MKMTLDLPDDLVQRIKIRAVQARKPLKRVVADLLAKALEAPLVSTAVETEHLPTGLEINTRGFPVIRCRADAPAAQMTVQQLIALEQQAFAAEDLNRGGIAR